MFTIISMIIFVFIKNFNVHFITIIDLTVYSKIICCKINALLEIAEEIRAMDTTKNVSSYKIGASHDRYTNNLISVTNDDGRDTDLGIYIKIITTTRRCIVLK